MGQRRKGQSHLVEDNDKSGIGEVFAEHRARTASEEKDEVCEEHRKESGRRWHAHGYVLTFCGKCIA